jgi:predicted acylesterase/phospholipase RssA
MVLRWWALLSITLGTAGCAHYPVNGPLTKFDGKGGYRFSNLALRQGGRQGGEGGDHNTDGVFVVLALSGGGYRAMLFHVGALWKLNEIGELRHLSHVSSVSGGSITAGVLAMNWPRLQFANGVATNFQDQIAGPLTALAGRTLQYRAGVFSVLPFCSATRALRSA